METDFRPAQRVDIKSEIYRAAVPRIIQLSKVAYARFRVLPKLDIAKNFVLLYFGVGFILEGIAGTIPAFALAIIGIPPGLVGLLFFLFWPIISFFLLGGEEHTVLSLALLFIAATYITDLKQKLHVARGMAIGSQAPLLLKTDVENAATFGETASALGPISGAMSGQA